MKLLVRVVPPCPRSSNGIRQDFVRLGRTSCSQKCIMYPPGAYVVQKEASVTQEEEDIKAFSSPSAGLVCTPRGPCSEISGPRHQGTCTVRTNCSTRRVRKILLVSLFFFVTSGWKRIVNVTRMSALMNMLHSKAASIREHAPDVVLGRKIPETREKDIVRFESLT